MATKRPQPPDAHRTYGRSRALRWSEYDYVSDAVIHLTMCAAGGDVFRNAGLAKVVCKSVERCCELREFRLFGYCLMPNHLHVLLSPMDSGVALSKWLKAFKSYTGHEHVRLGGRPPLWQRSAHDHVCREGETAETVLAYIIDNPVRAGLAKCWQDWPWTKVFIEV